MTTLSDDERAQMKSNLDIIGRDDINDLEAVLSFVGHYDVDATTGCPTIARGVHLGLREGRQAPTRQALREAKKAQWNGQTDLDWSIEVDQEKVVLNNNEANQDMMQWGQVDLAGTVLEKWGDNEWLKFGVENQNWLLSQFMHGEQGALLCTAKIVETVPWIDAKYYAATQVMDEARHVEVFSKYLDTKLSGHYPMNAHLGLAGRHRQRLSLDMTYLGMQIMVEGLALAASASSTP